MASRASALPAGFIGARIACASPSVNPTGASVRFRGSSVWGMRSPRAQGEKPTRLVGDGDTTAAFDTMVAVRAARFVYFTGSSFTFERDAVVANAPDDWLKGADDDPRTTRSAARSRSSAAGSATRHPDDAAESLCNRYAAGGRSKTGLN